MRFLKGHGTGNDFVVLPDHGGRLDLTAELVRALCDRHRGLGADGVLRVVRQGDGRWFLDYHNADGSLAEMCGNGVRVYARYLADAGLVEEGEPLVLATRAGDRRVRFLPGGDVAVGMGRATFGQDVDVEVAGRRRRAAAVDLGNPHAVVLLDPEESLDLVGSPFPAPAWAPAAAFPQGVNVEVVVRQGPGRLAMRVHERGVGETLSCGTGACAAAVATGRADGQHGASRWEVAVPGGVVVVSRDDDGEIELAGPAVLVAEGELREDWLRTL